MCPWVEFDITVTEVYTPPEELEQQNLLQLVLWYQIKNVKHNFTGHNPQHLRNDTFFSILFELLVQRIILSFYTFCRII